MSKYVIIGSALSGNKGAAAMLESLIQTLTRRDNNATFTLLSMYPKEDAKQNPYSNLTIIPATPIRLGLVINPLALLYKLLPPIRMLLKKYSRSINALANSNALLDQGGITFVDGREPFLLYNIASILPGLLVGTKVIKCAQALGPFKNPVNRFAAKLFLPRMSLIVARGKITHSYLLQLGLENTILGADYAFALKITNAQKRKAQEEIDMTFFKDGKKVGISPSVVIKNKLEKAGIDYIQIMADFINWLEDKEGLKVSLIPHSVRTGTNTSHNNDLPLCQEIYDKVDNKNNCLFVDKELGSQELRYIIGLNNLFIASRFHAMVSSLAMGVPTMVLGWSHKYKEVLDMFNVAEFAFDYKHLTNNELKKEYGKLVKFEDQYKSRLLTNLDTVKSTAAKQADYIIRLS